MITRLSMSRSISGTTSSSPTPPTQEPRTDRRGTMTVLKSFSIRTTAMTRAGNQRVRRAIRFERQRCLARQRGQQSKVRKEPVTGLPPQARPARAIKSNSRSRSPPCRTPRTAPAWASTSPSTMMTGKTARARRSSTGAAGPIRSSPMAG